MAVRFYDEALAEKLQGWLGKSKISILKPDETSRFFDIKLDQNKDKALDLPLICISRDKNIEILNTQKQAKTFDGFPIVKPVNKTESSVIIPLNVIPIRIGYQIDIYTRYLKEADEYVRNFVFNFINYPKLEITLPYNNLNIKHESIISLDPNISDNSDIKEHLFADEFTRFTLKISVDDAYLFSMPEKIPVSIEIEGLDIVDNNKTVICE